MEGVEFDENNDAAEGRFRSRALLGDLETPAMVRWLKRNNIVKTDKQAGYVLVTLVVIMFLLSVFVLVTYVPSIRSYFFPVKVDPGIRNNVNQANPPVVIPASSTT